MFLTILFRSCVPQASYVQDNMLLDENNPFCMLPPPLNLITISLYPFHHWALENLNISVCGTASDYILRYVGLIMQQGCY